MMSYDGGVNSFIAIYENNTEHMKIRVYARPVLRDESQVETPTTTGGSPSKLV